MGLIGNSRELTLVDLVQLKAQGPGTCRIQVQGARGPGVLFLAGSAVVHAEYAGAVGFAAAAALLSEERVEYWAKSGVTPPVPTMRVEARALVFQAAVQLDELRRAEGPVAAAAPDPTPPPPPRRPDRTLLRGLAGGAAVVIVVAVVALARIQIGPGEAAAVPARPGLPVAPASAAAPAPAPIPEPRRPEPVEASALTGARDELPSLVAGDPPRTPSPGLALRPTVVVRLLVDEGGAVVQAELYQPRPGLERFEGAALVAARNLRFRAARRDGAAVPVWINWPVDFI